MIARVDGGLEARVGRLEAIEAIRELKARYADVCDTGYDPVRMRPFFTEEPVVHHYDTFGYSQGVDAVCEFFAGISSTITWALHYMIAPAVDVDEDLVNAQGSWYLWQPCTIVTADGPRAVLITGRYSDRFRRENGQWLFSEIAIDAQTATPLDEGWVKTRFL